MKKSIVNIDFEVNDGKFEIKDCRMEIRLSLADKKALKEIAIKEGITMSELVMRSLAPMIGKAKMY